MNNASSVEQHFTGLLYWECPIPLMSEILHYLKSTLLYDLELCHHDILAKTTLLGTFHPSET